MSAKGRGQHRVLAARDAGAARSAEIENHGRIGARLRSTQVPRDEPPDVLGQRYTQIAGATPRPALNLGIQ